MHVGVQAAERFVESHLAGGRQLDVPGHQLAVPLDPAAPVERAGPLELDRAEALDEPARERLLPDSRALQDAANGGQDLSRIDRLGEVVADVGADRLRERGVLLALGDHHDRHVGRQLPQLAIRGEAALARHLLVEQHDVERRGGAAARCASSALVASSTS